MVVAVIVSDAPAPSPAIRNDTLRSPLLATLLSQRIKCAFWASTVIAMKPRAIMVQVRILNFFILFISDDFWLVFVWLGLLVPPIKRWARFYVMCVTFRVTL